MSKIPLLNEGKGRKERNEWKERKERGGSIVSKEDRAIERARERARES